MAVRATTVPRAQRCSVKFSYTPKQKSWTAHAAYLQREGAQRDEAKGLAFGQATSGAGVYELKEELDAKEQVSKWAKASDDLFFKAILSPEFGDKANLREFTKDFVSKVEKDLGTKLEWFAVEHYNTENPHVHVCIRGKVDDGRNLRISPRYIKATAGQRAREVLTNQLGYRSEHDLKASKDREVQAAQWTTLDAELLARQHAVGKVDLTLEPRPRDSRDSYFEYLQLLRRMKELEAMGLATKVEEGARRQWVVKDFAHTALFERSRANDRTKKVLAGEVFVSDSRIGLVAYDLTAEPQGQLAGREGAPGCRDWAAGRVLGEGLDQDSQKPFVLLEGLDGKVHFVALAEPLERGTDTARQRLKPGSTVWLEGQPVLDAEGKEIGRKVVAEPLPENSAQVVARFLAKTGGVMPALEGRDRGYADKFARAVYTYSQEQRRIAGQELLGDFAKLKLAAKLERDKQEQLLQAERESRVAGISRG